MADYSAMNSYLEQYNLNYFTFSPNSEKPIKAVICHPPPDMPAEDISNILEDLGFHIINARQMMATRTAPSGQTPVVSLPLFLVTLTGNIKYKFKLNSLNPIIIKVELYRAQTGLTQCYNCQNFGHVGQEQATLSMFVVWWWPPAQGMPRKKQIWNLCRAAAIEP
jgi:hypothetical protein